MHKSIYEASRFSEISITKWHLDRNRSHDWTWSLTTNGCKCGNFLHTFKSFSWRSSDWRQLWLKFLRLDANFDYKRYGWESPQNVPSTFFFESSILNVICECIFFSKNPNERTLTRDVIHLSRQIVQKKTPVIFRRKFLNIFQSHNAEQAIYFNHKRSF